MVTAAVYIAVFLSGMFTTKVIWVIQDLRKDTPPATKRQLRCAAKNRRAIFAGDRVLRFR